MRFSIKPMRHQKKATRIGVGLDNVALIFDRGLGKTKTAIDICENRKDVQRVIVLCDLINVSKWMREIHANAPRASYTPLEGPVWMRGIQSNLGCYKYHVTNHATAVDPGVRELLRSNNYDVCIWDESELLKNTRTARFKAVSRAFKDVPTRIILTGMPIANSEMDIFGQWLFLDGGATFSTSYFRFRNRYFKRYGWNWVLRKGAKESINKKIRQCAIIVPKRPGMGLPKKLYEVALVPPTQKQSALFKSLNVDFEFEYAAGKYDEIKYAMVKFLREAQVASGFLPSPDGVMRFKSNKIDALINLMQTRWDKEPVVIWSRFEPEIKAILARLKAEGFKATALKSDEDVRRFQSGKLDAVVGMYSKCRGFDLQYSGVTIHISNDYSILNRMQREDRINRIGSSKKTNTYIDICVAGSIDEDILEILKAKKKMGRQTLYNHLLRKRLANG